MLKIVREVVEEMIRDAKARAPVEACGYLGSKDGVVRSAYPLTNQDDSEEHFSFEPKEQFEAVRAMRKKGERPAAVYHSHPHSPARPSGEDLRLAVDASLLYVIVSLAGIRPDVQAYRIIKGKASREKMLVLDSEEGAREEQS